MNALAHLTGVPYPLPKLDLVPVHAFDSAAMENWGCMLFERSMLLAAESSPAALTAVQNTVVHEVAHQWFGNAFSMPWWHDLWLNEAFATLMASWVLAVMELAAPHALATHQSLPAFPDALWVDALHAAHLFAWQLFLVEEVADALGSRAVCCLESEVVSDADVESMFDGATYARGAAILRAVFLVLGPAAPLALRAYCQAVRARGGAASQQVLWDTVGPAAAHVGRTWMAAQNTQLLHKCGPRLVPHAIWGMVCDEDTSPSAPSVCINHKFAVPGLVPIQPGALLLFQQLREVDPAAALCMLFSAQHAVETTGSVEGWALVQVAAGLQQPKKAEKTRPKKASPLEAAALDIVHDWGRKCSQLKGMSDSELRGFVAAQAAKVAHTHGTGKFELRGIVQGIVRQVSSRADLQAWTALLEDLASATPNHPVLISAGEARDLGAQVQKHALATRKVCPLQQNRSPHPNKGGRRRKCCGATARVQPWTRKTYETPWVVPPPQRFLQGQKQRQRPVQAQVQAQVRVRPMEPNLQEVGRRARARAQAQAQAQAQGRHRLLPSLMLQP
jgi:hypothetical protein